MKKNVTVINNVEDYIASYPPPVRKLLKQMRGTIKKAAPEAEEVLSYHMPAYKYNGMLVYFAAHSQHIGFYPFKSAITAFSKNLEKYEGAKGTVRFPFDKPLPTSLISRMVKFRVKQNLEKSKIKKNKPV